MKKLIIALILLSFSVSSCDDGEKVLPGSTGVTHNILLIMNNQDWKYDLGETFAKYFAEEYGNLPQSEPLFSIHQADFDLFSGAYKIYRNVIVIKKGKNKGVRYYTDKYASPQLIIYIEGKDKEELKDIINKKANEIITKIRKFEIVNLQQKHRKSLRDNSDIKKNLGINIEIPDFFDLVDKQNKFIWLRRDVKSGEEDILLYEVPLNASGKLSEDDVIIYRDSIGKKYIPGSYENTYMKTYTGLSPSQKTLEINKHKVIETRGLWKMENDFMGGPYINYHILDKKNNRIIVAEGFIYAPAKDKRNFIVQLEAILKTIKI
jgi:hypothetical protein